MIKSINIHNYKQFSTFEIKAFKRINVFLGGNNTGKSSLLEALSIVATNVGYSNLKRLLSFRGINMDSITYNDITENEYIELFSTLYFNFESDKFYSEPITIISDVDFDKKILKSNISIQLIKLSEQIVNDNGIATSKLIPLKDGEVQIGNTHIGLKTTINTVSNIIPFTRNMYSSGIKEGIMPVKFIHSIATDNASNPELFDNIAMTSLQNDLVQALQIIEPRISNINFLKDSSQKGVRVPIVLLDGDDSRHRLTTMGDGINRVLNIILSLLNCKNGVLLIDEFENGLHYSIQKKLWKMIDMLSEKLNVQVFVTTHSHDCIDSFVSEINEKNSSVMRLEVSGGITTTINMEDREILKYALGNKAHVNFSVGAPCMTTTTFGNFSRNQLQM